MTLTAPTTTIRLDAIDPDPDNVRKHLIVANARATTTRHPSVATPAPRPPQQPTRPVAVPDPAEPPAPPRAKFGDAHRPSRADTDPVTPGPPPAAPVELSAGTQRACGCTIPPEISDAVAARNPRVHEPGCEIASDLELDRMTGRGPR